MEQMNITSAQYCQNIEGENIAILIILDGATDRSLSVPLDPANRHYAEIMRQVEAGELVIQEAE
jgi:hypothetical protein